MRKLPFSRRSAGEYLRKNWPFVALVVFVVMPLYWMAVNLAVSAGMFGFTNASHSTVNQVQMFMAFIGGGLASAATVFGALLTKQQNEHQEWRQNCEAVNAGLQSLSPGPSRVAGVLTNTVELGKPGVAVRVLDPVWRLGDVDAATATWIIDQVLVRADERSDVPRRERPSPATLREVAVILLEHAEDGDLTEAGHPRHYYIPDSLSETLNPALPPEVQSLLLLTTAYVLLSQEWQWWCDDRERPPRWPQALWISCVRSAGYGATAPAGQPPIGMKAAVLLTGLHARRIAEQVVNGIDTKSWTFYWDAKSRFDNKLGEYLKLARQISEKWGQGEVWREVFDEAESQDAARERARQFLKRVA